MVDHTDVSKIVSQALPVSKVKALAALLEVLVEKLVGVVLTTSPALVIKHRFTSVVLGTGLVV